MKISDIYLCEITVILKHTLNCTSTVCTEDWWNVKMPNHSTYEKQYIQTA